MSAVAALIAALAITFSGSVALGATGTTPPILVPGPASASPPSDPQPITEGPVIVPGPADPSPPDDPQPVDPAPDDPPPRPHPHHHRRRHRCVTASGQERDLDRFDAAMLDDPRVE